MNKKINKIKKLPKFSSAKAERDFWQKNDSSEFIDWQSVKPKAIFPSLHRSTKTISLRMTEEMYQKLRAAANKRDIPYQSYLKMIVNECLSK